MSRSFAILLTLSVTVAAAFAQDDPGPIRRAGQALDRAGKNIRYRVETEVSRGQEAVQDREVLHRVAKRIEWDKQFLGSTMRIEVQPGGRVVLRGSVLTDAVKLRAVDVASNTIGVAGVVDELAVVKDVKVIKTKPADAVIESRPSATIKTEVNVEP
jgi:hyperosmotically inducible protein